MQFWSVQSAADKRPEAIDLASKGDWQSLTISGQIGQHDGGANCEIVSVAAGMLLLLQPGLTPIDNPGLGLRSF